MSAEEFFERQEKKEKLKKRLQLAAIPVYYVVYISLMLLCWKAESKYMREYMFELVSLVAVPGIYYLSLFKADLLFDLKYLFRIDIENPEPSEWYYMVTSFSAYVLMILGLLMPLIVYVRSVID